MSENSYDNNSLSTLCEKDKVRLRPGVIFGSNGIEGAKHTLMEIVGNSRDEASSGFGKEINIKKFIDGSIEVEDFGRGIPIEYNEKEDKYNWEIVFSILYGGGKYSNNNENANYKYSIGLNGLGTAATQFASEYMDVKVFRDGFEYKLNFLKGENISNNKKGFIKTKLESNKTGTIIKWKPCLEVFNEIDIPDEFIVDYIKKQAIVNKGIKFNIYFEKNNNKISFIYEKGIKDYILEKIDNKNIIPIKYIEKEGYGRDREDKNEYSFLMELVFSFSNEISFIEYYHNSSHLKYGGSPDKAVKNGFTNFIDKKLKDKNLYKKNEKKIVFQDIEDSLVLITNTFSSETSYENQTKKAITNPFIQKFMTENIKKFLEIYFIENPKEEDIILNQLLINKRSREKAEKTRIDIKKKLNKKIDNISNKPKKFVNCRTKNKDIRELFIVEGDSALGSTKMGRDSDFQAIMPVRGKILNCLKSDYDKIFKNDIIVDLLKVLECGVEIESKQKELNIFNLKKLNWNKIIICTDADVDGFQIRTLILTMLYVLTPSLINEGYVYIAESPLYEISTKKENYFAFSEKEKNSIVKKINGNYSIQRSKGLGENDPDMMWKTTMNPSSRRLVKVTRDDAIETKKAFDLFLGDDLEGRKKYIEENGHFYLEDADIL